MKESHEAMANAWPGAEVYDWYGVGDTGIIAAEGPDHDGLYIWEDAHLVEILDPDRLTRAEVEISAMDFTQLSALRAQFEDRVLEMRENGGPALHERFVQEAAAIGMTIEEIVEAGSRRRGRLPKEKEADA